jgi:hypothetical protein
LRKEQVRSEGQADFLYKLLCLFRGCARKKSPLKGSKHADNLYGFQVSARPQVKKAASLIKQEALMLFVQPPRHQDYSEIVGSIPERDLMI